MSRREGLKVLSVFFDPRLRNTVLVQKGPHSHTASTALKVGSKYLEDRERMYSLPAEEFRNHCR